MFELEAVPQNCIPLVQTGLSIALYMRTLLLVESFDLHPSSQYILVSIILICFLFENICLCRVILL
jgi:hypothetical protein